MDYLRMHQWGDFGQVCDHDKELNMEAIDNGGRILSSYKINGGTEIWVLTEADRSATTILLPEEY